VKGKVAVAFAKLGCQRHEEFLGNSKLWVFDRVLQITCELYFGQHAAFHHTPHIERPFSTNHNAHSPFSFLYNATNIFRTMLCWSSSIAEQLP
jgi:hypothetical protein